MDKQLKFKEEFQHPKIHVFKISSHFVAVCLKLQVSKLYVIHVNPGPI